MSDSNDPQNLIQFSERKQALAAQKLALDPARKYQRQIEVYENHKRVVQKANDYLKSRGAPPLVDFVADPKSAAAVPDDAVWSLGEVFSLPRISWFGDMFVLDFSTAADALACLRHGEIKLQCNDERKKVVVPFTRVADIPYTTHWVGSSIVRLQVPQAMPGMPMLVVLRDCARFKIMSRSILT